MDRLERRFRRDLAAIGGPAPSGVAPVTDDDVDALPPSVATYLRAMGVVGRPRIRSFRAAFEGRFRRSPGGRWWPCTALQYNAALPSPTRLFDMRLRLLPLVSMDGQDVYLSGHGRMRGKLAGLIPVVDSASAELDASELVTYLNDAVLIAPSLLLNDHVTWDGTGPRSFRVRLTDGACTVGAHVNLDGEGRPTTFVTDDRWCALPGGLVRARWKTPIDDWAVVGGHPYPTSAAAVWELPDGLFRYIEGRFVPGSIVTDVADPVEVLG